MESEVDRAEKRDLVAQLNGVLADTSSIVVAHYAGLTVAEMTTLRGRMKAAGGSMKVAKNRLAKLALKDTKAAHIGDLLKGPTVIAYSGDPVAASKVFSEFAATNEKLIVLGGALGEIRLDPAGVKALATLPSLDELRAKIIGMLTTPATRIAQVVNAPAAQLARVVSAYSKKEAA